MQDTHTFVPTAPTAPALPPAPTSALPGSDVQARPPLDAVCDPLPVGHRLGDFELQAVLGAGGFGIVYRAFDTRLQRTVAVKEYMPRMLALRQGNHTVQLRADRFQAAFSAGQQGFINEARLLAQFDHPGLIKVLHFWEQHGTAYLVTPYYEGQTLKQRVAQGQRFSYPEVLALLAPLLGALKTLHDAQCYHRDIALDNILVQPDGRPVLLDFGAARRLIGDLVDEPAIMLKPGYAPLEQYIDEPGLSQGPWTDLYALGAVLHALLRGGALPPAAAVRAIEDRYQPLQTVAVAGFPASFLAAVDRMLALRAADRPASVDAFAAEIGLRHRAGLGFLLPEAAGVPRAAVAPAAPEAGTLSPVTASPAAQEVELPPVLSPDLLSTGLLAPESNSASLTPASPSPARLFEAPAPAQPRAAAAAPSREPTRAATRTVPWPWVAGVGLLSVLVAWLWWSERSETQAASPPVRVAQVASVKDPAAREPSPEVPASSPSALNNTGLSPTAPEAALLQAPEAPASAPDAMATPGERVPMQVAASEPVAEVPVLAAGPDGPLEAAPMSAAKPARPAPPRADAMDPVPVALDIRPWGQVTVNGVDHGASPPLRVLNLKPGKYQIEIKNGNLPPFVKTMVIPKKHSGKLNIKHQFE